MMILIGTNRQTSCFDKIQHAFMIKSLREGEELGEDGGPRGWSRQRGSDVRSLARGWAAWAVVSLRVPGSGRTAGVGAEAEAPGRPSARQPEPGRLEGSAAREWEFSLPGSGGCSITRSTKLSLLGWTMLGRLPSFTNFSMNEVVHTSPTIGSNVEETVVNNTRFLMWDIGGQESLCSSWNTYYTNTEFVIVVVDSTDRERISVTREELYKMLAHEDLRKAGLLIFANKQDVKERMTVAEIS